MNDFRDDVRALVIEIRRYVIAHDLLLGECVAWDRLKKLVGVGQDRHCPSEPRLSSRDDVLQ